MGCHRFIMYQWIFISALICISFGHQSKECIENSDCAEGMYCYKFSGFCANCTNCTIFYRHFRENHCAEHPQHCGLCLDGFEEVPLPGKKVKDACIKSLIMVSTDNPSTISSVILILGVSGFSSLLVVLGIWFCLWRRKLIKFTRDKFKMTFCSNIPTIKKADNVKEEINHVETKLEYGPSAPLMVSEGNLPCAEKINEGYYESSVFRQPDPIPYSNSMYLDNRSMLSGAVGGRNTNFHPTTNNSEYSVPSSPPGNDEHTTSDPSGFNNEDNSASSIPLETNSQHPAEHNGRSSSTYQHSNSPSSPPNNLLYNSVSVNIFCKNSSEIHQFFHDDPQTTSTSHIIPNSLNSVTSFEMSL